VIEDRVMQREILLTVFISFMDSELQIAKCLVVHYVRHNLSY